MGMRRIAHTDSAALYDPVDLYTVAQSGDRAVVDTIEQKIAALRRQLAGIAMADEKLVARKLLDRHSSNIEMVQKIQREVTALIDKATIDCAQLTAIAPKFTAMASSGATTSKSAAAPEAFTGAAHAGSARRDRVPTTKA